MLTRDRQGIMNDFQLKCRLFFCTKTKMRQRFRQSDASAGRNTHPGPDRAHFHSVCGSVIGVQLAAPEPHHTVKLTAAARHFPVTAFIIKASVKTTSTTTHNRSSLFPSCPGTDHPDLYTQPVCHTYTINAKNMHAISR